MLLYTRPALGSVRIAVVFAMLAIAPQAAIASAEFQRLEKVAGDRQIVLPPSLVAEPVSVRAVATDGSPVVDLLVYVTKNEVFPPCPFLRDEFNFFGFNYPASIASCQFNGGIVDLTDASGIASKAVGTGGSTPSAFLIGTSTSVPEGSTIPDHARRQFFSIIRAVNLPAGNPSVVVEYFNEDVRHYFNTILQSEIDVLDRWQIPGWTRSVGSFIAWEKAADAPPGAVPVCRFFSARYTSHFYTADPFECDTVVALFAEDWLLETREAFYIYRPDPVTGACVEGTMPVYRVFGGATRSPNHRYVTDAALRDVMVSQGWIAEGYGPNAVIMCTPR